MIRETEKLGARTVGAVGPSPVSRKLEAAVRERAGDYLANRILRDHRLPRQEMPEQERNLVLMEFIEAMAEFLGKEETQEILAEVGRGEGPPQNSARAPRRRESPRENV
jgi:hypothetical protein